MKKEKKWQYACLLACLSLLDRAIGKMEQRTKHGEEERALVLVFEDSEGRKSEEK